jgi:hypothetical protein
MTNRAEKRSIVEAREDGLEAEKKFEITADADVEV